MKRRVLIPPAVPASIRFEIGVRFDMRETASFSPLQLQAFFRGLALVIAEGRGELRVLQSANAEQPQVASQAEESAQTKS